VVSTSRLLLPSLEHAAGRRRRARRARVAGRWV